jgi:CRP-like cAMP-binding protein
MLHLTRGEIKELIGLSRVTVAQTFGQLRDRDLVALERSTLTIPDRVALERFAVG